MKIALFSDIHGNAIALEAVLKDIEAHNVDMIFCLGDLVGYGAYPNETIELIRKHHIPTVMGNYDDGVGYDRSECGCAYKDEKSIELGHRSLEWTKEHVTLGNKAYLRGLLHRMELTIYDRKILLVHGSPRKNNEYLFEDRLEDSLLRMINNENIEILVCGHTHLPYVKDLDGKYIVNSGSVGKPKDGDPRAGYVILTVSEKTEETEFVRVAYNVEAMVKAIEATGLPNEFATALREARG
jgi:putative phosphoesterase